MIARAPLVVVGVVDVDVYEEVGGMLLIVDCGAAVVVVGTEDWRWTFCANPTLN